MPHICLSRSALSCRSIAKTRYSAAAPNVQSMFLKTRKYKAERGWITVERSGGAPVRKAVSLTGRALSLDAAGGEPAVALQHRAN
jgi:hypothetical protein